MYTYFNEKKALLPMKVKPFEYLADEQIFFRLLHHFGIYVEVVHHWND
jgi:hypothetical protein